MKELRTEHHEPPSTGKVCGSRGPACTVNESASSTSRRDNERRRERRQEVDEQYTVCSRLDLTGKGVKKKTRLREDRKRKKGGQETFLHFSFHAKTKA